MSNDIKDRKGNILNIGDQVNVIDCPDWAIGSSLVAPQETIILGFFGRMLVVFKAPEFGGYNCQDNNGHIENGWRVDAKTVELIKPVKVIIPYTHKCNMCYSPARKGFCSNKKCKSRKEIKLTLPRVKISKTVNEQNYLLCFECDGLITGNTSSVYKISGNDGLLSKKLQCIKCGSTREHTFSLGEKMVRTNNTCFIVKFNRINPNSLELGIKYE